jgi:uncharacterized protein DUF1513
MRRRQFLAGSAALAGVGAAGSAAAACGQPEIASMRPAVYLVPGYRPDLAFFRGRPAVESAELRGRIPARYDGPLTLLTRIDEADGSVRRALMPLRGHAISVRPGGGLAVWNSMEGATLVSFDPASLELGQMRGFEGEAMVGGGHAVFLADGLVAIAERKQRQSYTGRPADHYGQVTIREAESLRVLESFSSHGMAPHDMVLIDGGGQVAIAHYGSHVAEGAWRPQIAEPCIAILELGSGKLVEKLRPSETGAELRHLAGISADRLAAVLVRRGSADEEAGLLASRSEVYEPDTSPWDEGAFLPAPVVGFAREGRWQRLPPDALLARQAQTILYDRVSDEFIATFTSSHAIGVFAAADGRVKRMIQADRLGLRYPRGLALHPDGLHYAVSGSWRDLMLFRRGSHEAVAGRAIPAVLFEHSHMTAV